MGFHEENEKIAQKIAPHKVLSALSVGGKIANDISGVRNSCSIFLYLS